MAEKPALRGGNDRKAELLAELAASRAQITLAVHDAEEDWNVAARLKRSILHQKTVWFTGAAVAGWILSRLPGRRKTRPQKASPEALGWQKTGKAGILFALLNLLFNFSKPFLTAIATRKVSQLGTRRDWGW